MYRDVIEQALDERRLLRLTYGGGGPRTVQPHAILRKPNGTELLEAYQVQGESESGTEHGWKHFDLVRIASVELLPQRFEPRRDFQPVSGQSGTLVSRIRDGATGPV